MDVTDVGNFRSRAKRVWNVIYEEMTKFKLVAEVSQMDDVFTSCLRPITSTNTIKIIDTTPPR